VEIQPLGCKLGCKFKVTVEGNEAVIELDEAVYGVAKGQVAVFYEDNKVLGSGFIKRTFQ
jgi:tRNA-uridine 2-sulfurtransferase